MLRGVTANNQQAARSIVLGYITPMMEWVRTAVIWLLVLALPAQGAAAATMALCNPNHHSILGAAQPHDHDASESAAPAARHRHEHAGARQAAGHENSPRAHGPQEDLNHLASQAAVNGGSTDATTSHHAPVQKLTQADQHKCSACASCCSAAAFSGEVVTLPPPQFEPTVFSSLVPSVQRFATDGPDRPPRSLVA